MTLYSGLDKLKASVRLQGGKRTLLQIIAGWRELSQSVIRFIRDPGIVANFVVTIAEALGVRQTERILKEFDENHMPVNALVVNSVIQEADCEFHRVRQAMQKRYWKILLEAYGSRFPLVAVPLSAYEVKGILRIREFGEILFRKGSIW